MFLSISHIDNDGFSCSLVLKVAYNDKIQCVNYGYKRATDYLRNLIKSGDYKKYQRIYITDLCMPEDIMESINEIKDTDFIYIDHHKTSEGYQKKYDWCLVVSNEEEPESATSLLWHYLYHQKFDTSKAIDESDISDKFLNGNLENYCYFVKLYDTWLWQRFNVKEASYLNQVFSFIGPYKYMELVKEKNFNVNEIIGPYLSAIEMNEKRIKEEAERYKKSIMPIECCGYKVGVIFCSTDISMTGNILSKECPEYDIIAMISNDGISFRASKDVDCTKIAKNLADGTGGGHAKSAGCPILENVKSNFINKIFEVRKQ